MILRRLADYNSLSKGTKAGEQTNTSLADDDEEEEYDSSDSSSDEEEVKEDEPRGDDDDDDVKDRKPDQASVTEYKNDAAESSDDHKATNDPFLVSSFFCFFNTRLSALRCMTYWTRRR